MVNAQIYGASKTYCRSKCRSENNFQKNDGRYSFFHKKYPCCQEEIMLAMIYVSSNFVPSRRSVASKRPSRAVKYVFL